MKRPRLIPMNILWFEIVSCISISAILALWGWLRPEVSLPFMGQSIVFSIRMPLLLAAAGLFVRVVLFACEEVWKWIYLS